MKPITKVCAVVLLAAAVMFLVYLGTVNQPPGRVDCMRVFTAARAYAQQLRAGGSSVPSAVSLRELISRKLLKPEDVSGFRGVEVTVSLTADANDPKSILMRAYFPDGHEMVALVDGSVEEVPKPPAPK